MSNTYTTKTVFVLILICLLLVTGLILTVLSLILKKDMYGHENEEYSKMLPVGLAFIGISVVIFFKAPFYLR